MSLKFGKIDDRPKIRPHFHHPLFCTYIESQVNIEQIDWKIFLRHMPNNLQSGYHRIPLDSYGVWIVLICCFPFTKQL